MKGADASAALGHCIRSSVPELHHWAGLLPSLDCEPPFPLSLGSLVNDAPDATGRWFGGTEHCCQGRAFPIPYTECGQLEGCCEDQPELTAPCSLRGEVKRDNNPPYLFSSVERTRPVMVTMCPSRRPPTILPVKGICCGEETASVGLPSSLHPYQPWPGLAWESGSSLGTQCSHEQDRRSLSLWTFQSWSEEVTQIF